MSPFSPGIAALSSKARNDRKIDPRFRGNDIKGSGNNNSLLPSPLEGEGQGEGDLLQLATCIFNRSIGQLPND